MTVTNTHHRRPAPPLAALFRDHLETFNARLEAGLAMAELDGAVIFSGPTRTVHRDDIDYPFHAEPYFKAWVPLTQHPSCLLKLVPGRRPLLIYLHSEDYWHESAAEPQGFWLEHFELRRVKTFAETMQALGGPLTRFAAIGERGESALGFDATGSCTLLRYLDFHRAKKTAYEAACIEEANKIAARGHRAARDALQNRISEFELHQLFCEATEQRETELPYPAIVALNEHASILHYQNLRRASPPTTRSLLLDAGAQFNGYASDITRTSTPVGSELEALISAVDTLQQSLCAQVRSGVDFVDLNDAAHRLLATILVEQRLVSCSAAQAYEEGITRSFLPHGLGHLLGLQVHDAGGRQISAEGAQRSPPPQHPHLRLTRVLEPGFVVTIEPGIYFIPVLLAVLAASPQGRHVRWDIVERMLPFGGIRIEDDVLVDGDGPRNLTRCALAASPQDLTRGADATS